jgi:hypothetical protein
MIEEIEDLRDQLTRIMLSVPTSTLGFDGNIPLYVKNAFDAQQAEIDRLTLELEGQRKRGDSLAVAFREAQGNEDKMLVELRHLRNQKDYLLGEVKRLIKAPSEGLN